MGSVWFPAKRYGFGWGLPVRWQGWVVLLLYFVMLLGGVAYFRAQQNVRGSWAYLIGLTAILIVIIAAKGERPLKWRWGND
jgi:hypothetical protein